MDSKEWYDVALELAKISATATQFFIAICTAFGGWIIAGGTVRAWPVFDRRRFYLMAIFASSSVAILLAQFKVMARIDAALAMSKSAIGEIPPNALPLFAPTSPWITIVGMGGVITFLCVLILTMKD